MPAWILLVVLIAPLLQGGDAVFPLLPPANPPARVVAEPDPQAQGLAIATVYPGSPAAQAGLLANDVLLSVNGWRIRDAAELRLLRRLRPADDALDLIVLRAGALRTLHATGVVRLLRLGFDPVAQAGVADLVGRLLTTVPDTDRSDLLLLPEPVLRLASADAAAATWFPHVCATWLAGLRGTEAPAPQSTPHAELDAILALWRLASVWNRPQAQAVDLEHLPVDAWTFALSYPWPVPPAPAIGKMHITDNLVQQALAAMAAGSSSDERRQAAARLVGLGKEPVERYTHQVVAAILDPALHGGWPFRSSLVWDKTKRAAMIASLQRWLEDPAQAQLADLGLIGPLVMDRDWDGLQAALERLQKASPWLANEARTIAHNAARMHGSAADLNERLPQGGMDGTVSIYDVLASRCPELSEQVRMLRGIACQRLLRQRPELAVEALSPEWRARGQVAGLRSRVAERMNSPAWNLAAHPWLADREQALAAGWRLAALAPLVPEFQDSVAACWARGGDFAAAEAWQRQAIRDGFDKESGTERLTRYRNQQCWDDDQPQSRPQPLRLAGPPAAVGQVANGKAQGRWRIGEAGVETIVDLLDQRPSGACMAPGGTGFFNRGARVGWWQLHDGQRRVVAQGWYDGQGPGQRVGWWRFLAADGGIRAEGLYLQGRRVGRWTLRDASGQRTTIAIPEGEDRQTWPAVVDPGDPKLDLTFLKAVPQQPRSAKETPVPPSEPPPKSVDDF